VLELLNELAKSHVTRMVVDSTAATSTTDMPVSWKARAVVTLAYNVYFLILDVQMLKLNCPLVCCDPLTNLLLDNLHEYLGNTRLIRCICPHTIK
jgi:hypothetical protein